MLAGGSSVEPCTSPTLTEVWTLTGDSFKSGEVPDCVITGSVLTADEIGVIVTDLMLCLVD